MAVNQTFLDTYNKHVNKLVELRERYTQVDKIGIVLTSEQLISFKNTLIAEAIITVDELKALLSTL